MNEKIKIKKNFDPSAITTIHHNITKESLDPTMITKTVNNNNNKKTK